ncbi:hypothetical protein L3X38_019657 [Prunus dulcis]|uniref:Uncharacterized protein n=1 Tax=Prunus dulcis TaxID=3755 RepID=A0AAD4WBE8_PRUDU|nr:hypothetical protein L3X38_019657 [Prunus dulcis]
MESFWRLLVRNAKRRDGGCKVIVFSIFCGIESICCRIGTKMKTKAHDIQDYEVAFENIGSPSDKIVNKSKPRVILIISKSSSSIPREMTWHSVKRSWRLASQHILFNGFTLMSPYVLTSLV